MLMLYYCESLIFFLNIFFVKDTIMDIMTHDTEDTMIKPIGLITTKHMETVIIINKCIPPGMHRKTFYFILFLCKN